MNLHEYQAKELFARYGIPVPSGQLAESEEAARQAAKQMGGDKWVVKAQVHAGGRGKVGGVKLVDSVVAVEEAARGMLGKRLVTKQTDADGLPINSVWIEEPSNIARELYVSAVIDRSSERLVFMCSPDGGMDIEEVAEKTPERIRSISVHPAAGLQAYQARQLGFFMGLDKKQVAQFSKILHGLYRIFSERDASLVEINPLIVTSEGDLKALDAKLNFDDNAMYRQTAIAELRDPSQEDEKERAAAAHGLNYVTLDGDIGCMVNGAGLAMATMDIIKLFGSDPANFLDVGGGATKERVTEAFKIILGDPNVEGILVNIFGGIMRCDVIAEGVVAAAKEVNIGVPLVVRLEGTNVEKGKQILEESGLAITSADNLSDAADKIVKAVKEAR